MDTTSTLTRLSADGQWWWDGERWVAAVSPDGLWTWDGERWRFVVEGAEHDPARLVGELDRLAAERFSEAGAILAARAGEWDVPDRQRAAVEAARDRLARLDDIDDQLEALEGQDRGLGALLGRRAAERRSLEAERDRLESELGPMLAELGQDAPEPSLKEADELRYVARRLNDAGTAVAAAHAEVTDHELKLHGRVSEAEAEIEALQRERETALAPALQAIEEAHEAQRLRLAGALERLRAATRTAPGEEVARLGEVSVLEEVVEWPGGRAPTAGAQAFVGTAAEVARAHTQLVDALLLAGAPAAREVEEAELTGSDERFLLLVTKLGAWLQRLAPEEVEHGEAFAEALASASRKAARRATDRASARRAAREDAEQAAADSTDVDDAERRYREAAEDPRFEAPLREARARLDAARAEPPELTEARLRLETLLESLMAPPPPLAAAG